MILGALEAGGTKMICAIGNENGEILEQVTIPTETPENTLPKIIEFYRNKDIESLGVGCFGPVDLNHNSLTYGYITSTPKIPWKNCNIVGILQKELQVPIGFDTDVNSSCLGEATWGALKGLESGLYITIGTGIGVGIYSNKQLIHNMLHPEAGHILLVKHPEDKYSGNCPYHKVCLEGLAAGPAIERRWGRPAEELLDNDKVWEIESYYIAQALMNYILTISPHRIILGGGVMHVEKLFPLIRNKVKELNNGYIQTKELENLDTYIIPAALNDSQGIMGCLFQLALLEL